MFQKYYLQSLLAGLAVLLLIPANVLADQCRDTSQLQRPKIGLALGGGGARGYAHIGVLQVLEELRVPYDFIAGTSMGSIVGGMTSTGMNANEILDVIKHADWDDLFNDNTARSDIPARRKADDRLGLFGPKFGIGKTDESLPEGVIAGQKVLFLFETVISQRVQSSDFDALPIPYRAVATDIVNGKMKVLDSGALSVAMRASMAVPAYFDPVRIDGDKLVDGGLVRNLPVDVVRNMGADHVIAVDVGSPLRDASNIGNIISIVDQMSSLLIVENTRKQVEEMLDTDVLIAPDLGHKVSAADFDATETIVPLGYEAADSLREQLSRFSLSEEDYSRWKQQVASCVEGPPEVHFVRLNNSSRFSDEVLRSMVHVEVGGALDTEQLDKDLRQIYGLGFIHLAHYELVEEDGQLGVEISVQQSTRGTDFIETGLSINGSSRGTEIGFRSAYLKTDVDERGSELRAAVQLGNDTNLLVDFYRPVDDKLRFILQPEIFLSRRDLLAFNDAGQALANVEVDEVGAGIRFSRTFSRHSELSMNVQRFAGSADVTLGDPVPKIRFDGGEWGINYTYDRLDNRFLPSNGARIQLDYISSEKSLGADAEFEQIRFDFLASESWGPHSVLWAARYNTTLDDNAPIYALFTGGGQFNMSGFEPNELIGQHFGMVATGYRYKINQDGLMPGYAGFTLEYGNAANEAADVFGDGILNGSIYMSYDTFLGPVYFGYGVNKNRSGTYFLTLGSPFGAQSIGRR